jgi:hypothetical protein
VIKTETRELPASILTIDPRVQRKLDQRRVDKLAAEWDDLMVGIITVSHRAGLTGPFANLSGGTEPVEEYVVLDGQTRLAAFRQVCGQDTDMLILAQVHIGLTLEEEAEIFLKHNNRKAVSSTDRFRIAVVAGEPWALDITEILAEHNWTARGVTVDGKPMRQFSGVVAAEKIYRQGGYKALKNTFVTIENAWGSRGEAVCTHTLYGLGLLHARHPELVSKQLHGLVTKLSKVPVGTFIGEITSDRRRYNQSLQTAAYDYVIELYNKGRSEDNRLS